jgi:hypothetical protein
MKLLALYHAAGLVKMRHVALEGTREQANASKHKAMGYCRMGEAEEKLRAQVRELLARVSVRFRLSGITTNTAVCNMQGDEIIRHDCSG